MDSKMTRFPLAWLLLAGVLACWVPSAQGKSADLTKEMNPFLVPSAFLSYQTDLPTIIKHVQASGVLVLSYDKRGVMLREGGGFFISPEGHIITSRHVLQGASQARVRTAEGRIFPLQQVLAEDREGDLIRASVQIPREAAYPLSLSPSLPDLDQPVMVIGSPLGQEPTVAQGIVSAIWTVQKFGKLLQIEASISPGSSGSPVVNMRGEVIGVASVKKIEGCDLVFAIPAERVNKLKLGKGGSVDQVKPDPRELLVKKWLASGEGEYVLGLAFLYKGCYEQAIAHLARAAQENLSNAEIHCRLGDGYYRMRRYAEAKHSLQQAIRLKPGFADAHYGLGMAYLKLGDRGSALQEYNILRNLDKEKADKLFSLIYE